MRTTTQKEVKKNKSEVKQEFNLKEAFVLWKKKSSKGNEYLSGFTADKKTNLVGYFNTDKKNPKEPDVHVYVSSDDTERVQVASLWANVGKNDNTYLSGTTNENEKLVAFYGKEHQELRPYIRAYYKED